MTEPYYERDGITIYHGDCREVLPTIAAGSIDLVLTDPPYQSLDVEVSVGTTTRLVGRDQLAGKRLASSNGKRWFSTIPSSELSVVFREFQRVLASHGALYVFGDVKSGLEIFPALTPANVLVWDKGEIGMGYSWRRMHEWIAYCPMPDHKLKDKGAGDILRVTGVMEKRHPTEKPVALMRKILRNSAVADALVLDPFMGVGATLLAAKHMGFRGIGIELEERYCEIAAERLQQAVLPMEVA